MPDNAKTKRKAFWTIKAIAEDLDVSERTVHRWIAEGDPVAHRFGRALRIADGDYRAFLIRHRDI